MSKASFTCLRKVWNHAVLHWQHKPAIDASTAESKTIGRLMLECCTVETVEWISELLPEECACYQGCIRSLAWSALNLEC